MEGSIALFQALFDALGTQAFGMPLIAWIMIPCFFGLIGMFFRGKK